jgi:stalled ribosome alternative rescue factor ArfA
MRAAKLQMRSATPKKSAEDEISDNELDSLLKDPKYASIAGDLLKPGESIDSLLSTNTKPAAEPAPSGGHYMSTSYKDHLERMKKGKSSTNVKSTRDNTDLFGKSLSSDPMKELEMMGGSTPKSEEKPSKDKKPEVNEKFKAFDFISKQQARYLLEILKQPVFFNMLPSEAQTIVKVILL